MLFNSLEFIFIFLPLAGFLYFLLLKYSLDFGAKLSLVACSLFFYSYWRLDYLPIICVSIFLNYWIGHGITSPSQSRAKKNALVVVGVLVNLGLLCYYKYADFILENVNAVTGAEFQLLELVLPLAISFFTFQQITYLVDCYRGEGKRYDFLTYTLFVSFFPQLIAGPIVHHGEMMPQFCDAEKRTPKLANVQGGLYLFTLGLFKKVVCADTFATWANYGFGAPEELTMIEAWASSFSYTFQLYFDFSGYSDMAIGAAMIFNIFLPINFNSPYKATNLQDFWRRWHITLSRFLREYVYIPLGGNRKREWLTHRNLLLTFVLGGIWHGAGWNFIIWGLLHGLALVLLRCWKKLSFPLPKVLAWLITFQFINITWVFFRAESFQQAIQLLKKMFAGEFVLHPHLRFLFGDGFTYSNFVMRDILHCVLMLIIGFASCLLLKNSIDSLRSFSPTRKYAFNMACLIFFITLCINRQSEFLYFNF